MWRNTIRITSALALAAGACVSAGASIGIESSQRGTDVTGTTSPGSDVERHSPDPSLKVDNIHLGSAPSTEKTPSAILKFRVSNQGTKRLTDLYLQISIVEKLDPDRPSMPRRVLAGPFMMRAKAVLEAGFTIDSEVLLRNLSPGCRCVPTVEVVSVRALANSGS